MIDPSVPCERHEMPWCAICQGLKSWHDKPSAPAPQQLRGVGDDVVMTRGRGRLAFSTAGTVTRVGPRNPRRKSRLRRGAPTALRAGGSIVGTGKVAPRRYPQSTHEDAPVTVRTLGGRPVRSRPVLTALNVRDTAILAALAAGQGATLADKRAMADGTA